MPFSNTWDNSVPPDNQVANLLGDDVRQLKLDIVERMNTLGITDFTADLLVVGLARVLRATAVHTHTYGSGGGTDSFAVTVTGARAGDLVVCAWKGDGTGVGTILLTQGIVSADNTVTIGAVNYSSGNAVMTNETIIIAVIQKLP